METEERWLPVVGWSGYAVSDQGRVRSLPRTVLKRNGGRYRVPERILKPSRERKTGRLMVLLHGAEGREKSRRVHHLVLEAFVGPRPAGMEACHTNDDQSDNRLVNLRWDTRSANELDKVRNGNQYNANKTHCKYGHPFSPENTIIRTQGGRACRECTRRLNREAMRRRRDRRPEKGVCGQCGHERESNFYKLCDRCREYRRERSRQDYAQKKSTYHLRKKAKQQ